MGLDGKSLLIHSGRYGLSDHHIEDLFLVEPALNCVYDMDM